jgi:hypothetical protein
VAQVVINGPALQYRDDRQVGCKVPELEQVVDCQTLVFGDCFSGSGEHEGFAHPVLLAGPLHPADLGVAPYLVDVFLGGGFPCPVHVEFGETTGVQRPVHGGSLNGGVAV